MRANALVLLVLFLSALWVWTLPAGSAAEPRIPADILSTVGRSAGIVALLGDRGCERALALARSTRLTVFVQLPKAEEARAAREAADAAGLYGRRVYVERGGLSRILLADNLADLVVLCDPAQNVGRDEVVRILRPGGVAVLGTKRLTKPFPKGTDDWSHHYHGPDNNPQSNDTLARAPYLTQFIADPRYAACPQNAVASAGRVFMAFGHVAWHRREEPVLNTLIAMNGFNGCVLWKRQLTSGIMVDRSTMIATPEVLYLADESSCKLLDAATGELKDEIRAPEKLTDGTFWKWMALESGVLYALVGKDEGRDPVARWRRTGHGWPWGAISKGYNRGPYAWGFGKVLLAIDRRTKKVLWHHAEEQGIDSRSLCVKSGRIYFCSFGKYLACLDAQTGKVTWRKTAKDDPGLFQKIGGYRPGHGYIGGWKSTVYLKCTDQALYFIGPQVHWLTAVSAKDGSFLWKYPQKDLHAVVRDDGLYIIGPQNSRGQTRKLDPLTGKVLATYPVSRRACTRSVGTADSILFRAPGGSVRLDLASGKPEFLSPMRPPCQVGVVVANGHLYWLPWVCDCNLQMFGVISCAPAGPFKFGQQATEKERLEVPADGAAKVAPFETSPKDWPAYRADSARTAETKAAVPEKTSVLWTVKARGSAIFTAPVAAGGMVFVGCSNGVVRALDAATGRDRWRAYTGATVRYPPSVADGRVFVGSGDGYAYAFEAATGRLLWRFRAAPTDRRIPVYGRLLSTWPVSGGVLADKGVAYFVAGINSYDGTHVYAVDAATGKIKWQNNTSGRLPGGAGRGVAAQGDLLLHGGRLYLAGGNGASIGIYDGATGKCLSHAPRRRSLAARGRELSLQGGKVLVSGQPFYSHGGAPVYHGATRWRPVSILTANARLSLRRGAGGKGQLLVAHRRADNKELWSQPIPGWPVRWGVAVDAQGRVIVAAHPGRIVCFGQTKNRVD